MKKLALLITLTLIAGLTSGCKPKQAQAQAPDNAQTRGGTVNMTFYLEDGTPIYTSFNLDSSSMIRVNRFVTSQGEKMRLTGNIKLKSQNAHTASFHLRMMLYKNSRPNSSFDFPASIKRGQSKDINLGSGMRLQISF